MEREEFVRSYNDYILMGYSSEQAESQSELEKEK
jgi:hypothetical protein